LYVSVLAQLAYSPYTHPMVMISYDGFP